MKCFGCGVEKDPNSYEVYAYDDDALDKEESAPALIALECQQDGEENFGIFKAVVVCQDCFHALTPDLWILEKHWRDLNPRIPFENLPMADRDYEKRWKPETYGDVCP